MRLLALKVCALVLALGVLVVVVQASRSSAQSLERPVSPSPSASSSGAAVVAGGSASLPEASEPPVDDSYGIIGPATKADPHVMRRAVKSLKAPPSKGDP